MIDTPEMTRLSVPELPTTTTCAALEVVTFWLPKFRLAGARVMIGMPVPVPLKVTLWGLPVALSVKVSMAERIPTPAGVKLTLTEAELMGDTVSGNVG